MFPKSIKTQIRMATLVIVGLAVLSGVNTYLGKIAERSDARYHDLMQLQLFLSELVRMEDAAVAGSTRDSQLGEKYDRLARLSVTLGSVIDEDLQTERRQVFDQLLATENERLMLHRDVYQILPQLAESVRYIHEHHIAYLKNLMARGIVTQDYDTGKNFERSPVQSASELDIVNAATAIQTNLMDLLTQFYVLQQNRERSHLKTVFARYMKNFYDSVNTFEDYSLDAQDGLLVEELLMTGRSLEASFTKLCDFEDKKKQLSSRLSENRSRMNQAFRKTSQAIVASHRQLKTDSDRLQLLIFLASLMLAGFVLYSGQSIIRQILGTVAETERIREDLSYQIDVRDDVSSEFRVVHDALNSMANTIDDQFRELDEARNYLQQRVQERTADLVEANRQLLTEIEERAESEKARRDLETKLNRAKKMEAIGTLAGGVAHDLNNILSGILSYPDLILMDMARDDPLRKALTTIKASGEKAAAIVQDLLTLARRGVVASEIVCVNDVVSEFLGSPEFARIRSDHPGLEVEAQLNSRSGAIRGSSVHLSKTVMNLIANAAEAIPGNGKIVVTTEDVYIDTPLRGYDDVNEGEYARLTVSDTGIGISPEDLERIFEPFFTRKQMGRSGTGLGMAVVWGTVKDHHGYINVESSEGKGTTFQLYFPLCRDLAAIADPQVDMDVVQGKGEFVLVVDDVPEQREIAAIMLKRLGYHAEAVAGGEQALEVVRQRQVALLLLDMIMPTGMDGLETYRKALEIRPGQKAIIASGYSESRRVKAALKLGAQAYLRKPYTMAEIAPAVRSAIDS